LIKQVEKEKSNYIDQAKVISKMRQEVAAKLSKLVMQELMPLKLEKARFEISIEDLPEDQWTVSGIDKVRFLVATNPGAEAGALNKIASGGELSRLMLAIKVVLAEVGIANSLVFDEVDSGIGGATAAAVGERLLRLADHRQILVVTHSPQVAAMAQNHYIVAKEGAKEVKTNIVYLEEMKKRQEEIARMLSGAEITEEARAAALKLLSQDSSKKSAA
jgi:DNA repair protein RecN (Recombination protein N)